MLDGWNFRTSFHLEVVWWAKFFTCVLSYWVYHGALVVPLEDYLASFCTVIVCFKDTLCDSNVISLHGISSNYFQLQSCFITMSFTLKQHMLRCTVRLLTHVLCKPTHFFFDSFIAIMSYYLQTSLNSLMKDWADKYHVWGTPTRSPSRSNSQ